MNYFISKPDYASFAGLAIALMAIFGGLQLEKGQIQDLGQLTAVVIVLGGTTGAVLLSTSRTNLGRALRRTRQIFWEERPDEEQIIEILVRFAVAARRGGIVSIEKQVDALEDPFLRKGLTLAVDGSDTQEIRRMMELDLRLEQDRTDADAGVFEMAGGYAPTIGIIGAVLGLIQVMKHLDNIAELGHGIATAFVATIYGVGSSNLLLLPAAAKVRSRARQLNHTRELMLEGILAIAEGLNPRLVRMKLEAYMGLGSPAPPRAETAAAAFPIRSGQ